MTRCCAKCKTPYNCGRKDCVCHSSTAKKEDNALLAFLKSGKSDDE